MKIAFLSIYRGNHSNIIFPTQSLFLLFSTIPPRPAGPLPHRGRIQVDFASEAQRNRYGIPADTQCRGNLHSSQTKILPHWGSSRSRRGVNKGLKKQIWQDCPPSPPLRGPPRLRRGIQEAGGGVKKTVHLDGFYIRSQMRIKHDELSLDGTRCVEYVSYL